MGNILPHTGTKQTKGPLQYQHRESQSIPMADDRRGVVGYALLPKKQQTFIQASLVSLCKSKGVDLVKIDQERRLTDQGPFNCVLHKLDGEHWRKQLEELQTQNPNSTKTIDST
ncbi:hypothetical protein OIU76_021965 [Salix suchowensis]|nr:hypothetical protein OIU76_021965 [Salix suchowensis]